MGEGEVRCYPPPVVDGPTRRCLAIEAVIPLRLVMTSEIVPGEPAALTVIFQAWTPNAEPFFEIFTGEN